MTISTLTTRVAYQGNGATVNFAVPFIFFGPDELLITERALDGSENVKALTTHYTVSGGNGTTGTITALVAPPANVTWVIKRNTKRTQLVDYTPNDPFPANTHELALDRLQAQIQDSAETLDRSAKLRVTSPLAKLEMPDPSPLQIIRWNTAGNGLENVSANNIFIGATLTDNLVTTSKIADNTVTTSKIVDNSVTTSKMADNAVTAPKIADDSITLSKLNSVAGPSVLGNPTGSPATPSVISLGPSLEFSGTKLQLKNDAGPQRLRYFGTDGSFNVGWFDIRYLGDYSSGYSVNEDITAVIPLDDTTPLISEGFEIISLAVPIPGAFAGNAPTTVRVRFSGYGTANGSIPIVAALFNSTTCLAVTTAQPASSGQLVPLALDHTSSIGGPVSSTWSVRVGPGSAGAIRLNGTSSGRLFGGRSVAQLVVQLTR